MEGSSCLNLPISKIGYGCYALSGAYGDQLSRKEKTHLLQTACDLGITYFDTASSYDDTEQILGSALKDKRSQVVISSKIGMSLGKKEVIQACEKSLKNLGTDYIDIYQVHYKDPHTPIDETLLGFDKLKQDGKIRHYGIGHLPLDDTVEYLDKGNVSTVLAEMSAVSLFRYHELKPLLSQYNFGIIAFSVTGRGVLSGKITEDTRFEKSDIRAIDPLFKKHRLLYGIKIANQLESLGSIYHLSAIQMGILWVMNKKGIISSLIGPTKIEHLKENIKIMDQVSTVYMIKEMDEIIYKANQDLVQQLSEDTSLILNQPLSHCVQKAFDDLVCVLEYYMENSILPYEIGIKLFKRLISYKNKHQISIEFLEEIKDEIIKHQKTSYH